MKLKKNVLLAVFAAVLMGCGMNGLNKSENSIKNNSTAPVSMVRENYITQTEELKKDTKARINFSNCYFYDFPEMDSFSSLKKIRTEMTEEDALELGSQVLIDQNLADNKEDAKKMLQSDSKWLQDIRCYETDEIVINIASSGLFQFDDGRLSDYNGHTIRPALTVMGPNDEDLESVYYPEQFTNISYKLADCEMSLKDAADIAENYFASSKYDIKSGEIESKVWRIDVYRYQDFYEYYIHLYRIYHGISIAPGYLGAAYSEDYSIREMRKNAIICDSKGVCSFSGYTESEQFIESSDNYTEMLDLSQAADIMKNKLGAEISAEIERTGLFYVQILDLDYNEDDEYNRDFILCWRFEGKDLTSAVGLIVYVDVVNGNIYLKCPHD